MNTIAVSSNRNKFRLANLDQLLRNGLVAEKVCMVDRGDNYTIQSPYGSQPTTTIQALSGLYTPAAYTVTVNTLTVADEFVVAEHVFDFENVINNFDLFANRTNEQQYSVAAAIDKYVVNGLAYGGTGSYTTPTGGFTTAANLNTIMASLISKVSGYSEVYNGMYLIVENTDLAGIIPAMATNGFSYADSALNNGFVGSYMGVDIYVVRTGTFVSEAEGSQTWANSGCRVFGVKNMATYAAPRGIRFEEKGVSGKTGKEIVTYGYIGMKVWGAKAALTVKITLA